MCRRRTHKAKEQKVSLVADCLQFFFFISKKKKITNSFSIKDTKHKLLLFSDFILKPKIPNTLEGILMLIHTLEKAFFLLSHRTKVKLILPLIYSEGHTPYSPYQCEVRTTILI